MQNVPGAGFIMLKTEKSENSDPFITLFHQGRIQDFWTGCSNFAERGLI